MGSAAPIEEMSTIHVGNPRSTFSRNYLALSVRLTFLPVNLHQKGPAGRTGPGSRQRSRCGIGQRTATYSDLGAGPLTPIGEADPARASDSRSAIGTALFLVSAARSDRRPSRCR